MVFVEATYFPLSFINSLITSRGIKIYGFNGGMWLLGNSLFTFPPELWLYTTFFLLVGLSYANEGHNSRKEVQSDEDTGIFLRSPVLAKIGRTLRDEHRPSVVRHQKENFLRQGRPSQENSQESQ